MSSEVVELLRAMIRNECGNTGLPDSVHELEGHRRLVPALMAGATDARFWRERGSAAYGVGLYDDNTGFSDLLSRFHGADERISIESIERTTALYERILHNLDQ
jgi:acetylornithine deacetylase/succinyl-diaminopimelate desuccinylase-like protein